MQYEQKSGSQKNSGKITYGNNIIAPIIALAAKEISGVASLHGNGVRTHITGSSVDVNVLINVFAGYSCPDVAFRVQENVKRMIETMSKYKIGIINVFIIGVTYKPDEEAAEQL